MCYLHVPAPKMSVTIVHIKYTNKHRKKDGRNGRRERREGEKRRGKKIVREDKDSLETFWINNKQIFTFYEPLKKKKSTQDAFSNS